jgi:hypothetical protein
MPEYKESFIACFNNNINLVFFTDILRTKLLTAQQCCEILSYTANGYTVAEKIFLYVNFSSFVKKLQTVQFVQQASM